MHGYEVINTRDDLNALSETLNEVASKGGKVVNVQWVPSRPNPKNPLKAYKAKYVVVAEFSK